MLGNGLGWGGMNRDGLGHFPIGLANWFWMGWDELCWDEMSCVGLG